MIVRGKWGRGARKGEACWEMCISWVKATWLEKIFAVLLLHTRCS